MKSATVAKKYLAALQKLSRQLDIERIVEIIKILERKLNQGKTIFIAGNGGSASTASHMVCDLNKTVLGKNPKSARKRFRVLSLSDNVPSLTAIGNDLSYDLIFSEPLKNYGQKGDLLLIITGSGNSKNIIEAIKTAKSLRMETAAFLGFDGGKTKNLVDGYVLIPSFDYGPVEDFHLILNHLITTYLKEKFSK